jgi:hypothetical protein
VFLPANAHSGLGAAVQDETVRPTGCRAVFTCPEKVLQFLHEFAWLPLPRMIMMLF